MTFLERILEYAAAQVGRPYVWGGKGEFLWTMHGPTPSDFGLVFDCIGLVTRAIKAAGGPDYTQTDNVQTFFEKMMRGAPANAFRPHLRYYGVTKAALTHIAIGIPVAQGGNLVIEAAGGGHLTTKPTEGARVFFHYETRKDMVAQTSLPDIVIPPYPGAAP